MPSCGSCWTAAGLSSRNGLTIAAGGSTVRGLVINRFSGRAIDVSGGGGNRIVGNFLGTDVAGVTGLGNGTGVRVTSPSNTIGGTTPADRNVISANSANGVEVSGPARSAT